MERLTVNSGSHDERYTLKCMCKLSNCGLPEWEYDCRDYCDLNADDCEYCGIREAFDLLAAYEDTGLTPEGIKDLQQENQALKAFKEYFDEMYGKGLEVANWHLNGELEPFDNFYDGAINEMTKGEQQCLIGVKEH